MPTALISQGFNQALFIPDTISSYDNSMISLTIAQTSHTFFPGAAVGATNIIPGFTTQPGISSPITTYSYSNPTVTNPGVLGPTLIWWKGDSVTMMVDNTLSETTTTHWHGAHVAPYNDGGPHQHIHAGEIWTPSFKIRDDVSTLWYHPHLHETTQKQVNLGMAGMILVKDANDPLASQLPHSYGVDDWPIILQDKFFGYNTTAGMYAIDTSCSMGTNFLVNGTWQPFLDVPAQMNRFRILNGSSERSYCLFLRDSTAHAWVPFNVIASDAGYLVEPYPMGHPPYMAGNPLAPNSNAGDLDSLLMIMSGERYEIVFDASGLVGHDLYLMNMRNYMVGTAQIKSFAGGPNLNDPSCYANTISNGGMIPDVSFDSTPLTLMKINVMAANGNPGSLPTVLQTYPIPNAADADVIRDKGLYLYNFDTLAPPFSIDSINYDMEIINDTVYLNDIEVWNINNVSQVAHPFHIHDIHFFIQTINGLVSNVPPYMRGPKDVAPVTNGSKLSLVTQFTDFSTAIAPDSCYMYHCHILAHEDGGMMHQFVVTPRPPSAVATTEQAEGWNVFPNPTGGTLSVEFTSDKKGSIQLYDMMGRPVKTWDASSVRMKNRLNISEVANGLYLLKCDHQGGSLVKQILVAH